MMEKRELPAGWEWKRLGDVFENIPLTGKKLPQQKYEKTGSISVVDQGQELIGGYTNRAELKISENLPLIGFGDHTRIIKYLDFEFVAGADGIKILKPLEGIDPKYFFYASNWVKIPDMGYSRHFKFYRELLIPLPPLSVQRQIVAVLEQAEAVKRQRQEADALTGALLQSVFYEMFGDPVRNEKGWRTQKFEECMSSIIDYRGKTPTKTKSGIPLVTAKIVKDGVILSPDEFISPDDYDSWMRRGIPKKGDVILTTEGPLGTIAQLHTEEKLAFAQRLIILRGKTEILDNTYLAQFFRSDYFQNQLKSKATGSTVEGISQGNLRDTLVRIPPLALQQQFARIVQDVERIREQQAASRKEIEGLCKGLISRAFSGELPTENA